MRINEEIRTLDESNRKQYFLSLIKSIMKVLILFFGIISALILGFLLAGFSGAFLFALILTLTIYLIQRRTGKNFTYKVAVGSYLSFFTLGYFLMHLGGLTGSDPLVLKKLELIQKELKSKGYETNWMIISQKRSHFLNSLLPNSSKGTKPGGKSYHLFGKAVDIYVFDINGDGVFNRDDIKILACANNSVEKNHPELIGGFGDYFLDKHGYLTKHMIHIDIRGYKKRYTL